jgi:hypothetical protein
VSGVVGAVKPIRAARGEAMQIAWKLIEGFKKRAGR